MYKQFEILAGDLNLSARVLTNGSWVTSDAFGCDGYSQLTLEINYPVNGDATDVQFYVETSYDNSVWHRTQSVSTLAGTATLSDVTYVKALTTIDQWTVNIPINYKMIRLAFTGTAANGTTDVVTVRARLGV